MKKEYKLFKYYEKKYNSFIQNEENIILIFKGEKIEKKDLLFFEKNNFIILEIESYLKNEKNELLINYVHSYMDEINRSIKENENIYPEQEEIKEDYNKIKIIKSESIDDFLVD